MAINESFLKAYKKATGQLVEKPGNSTHTAAWDRCVEHVKNEKGSKNAYAICTAAMGNESFKSISADDPDFIKEVDLFMEKLGIAGAGPVPNSLLSRQDLERETVKFSKHIRHEGDKWNLYSRKTGKLISSHSTREGAVKQEEAIEANKVQKDGSASFSVWYSDDDGNNKCEVYNNMIDAEASADQLKELGYKNVYIHSSQDETEKGRVESTGKQLNNAVRAAKQVDDSEDAETIADRIKNIQLRRQKATIAARSKESVGKSFKDVWSRLNKNNIY